MTPCIIIIDTNKYLCDPLEYCIDDAIDLNETLRRIAYNITLEQTAIVMNPTIKLTGLLVKVNLII